MVHENKQELLLFALNFSMKVRPKKRPHTWVIIRKATVPLDAKFLNAVLFFASSSLPLTHWNAIQFPFFSSILVLGFSLCEHECRCKEGKALVSSAFACSRTAHLLLCGALRFLPLTWNLSSSLEWSRAVQARRISRLTSWEEARNTSKSRSLLFCAPLSTLTYTWGTDAQTAVSLEVLLTGC